MFDSPLRPVPFLRLFSTADKYDKSESENDNPNTELLSNGHTIKIK